MSDSELLTPQEAAEFLKLSVHTLAAWRSKGQPNGDALPWIEVGNSVRYRRTDIQAWLDKRTLGGVLPA